MDIVFDLGMAEVPSVGVHSSLVALEDTQGGQTPGAVDIQHGIEVVIATQNIKPDIITLYKTSNMLLSLAHQNDGVLSDQNGRVDMEGSIWEAALQGTDFSANVIQIVQLAPKCTSGHVFLWLYSSFAQGYGSTQEMLFPNLRGSPIQDDSQCMLSIAPLH